MELLTVGVSRERSPDVRFTERLIVSQAGRELGFDVNPRWAELSRAAKRWDKRIHLAPLRRTQDTTRQRDQDDARVYWGTTRDGLAKKIPHETWALVSDCAELLGKSIVGG